MFLDLAFSRPRRIQFIFLPYIRINLRLANAGERAVLPDVFSTERKIPFHGCTHGEHSVGIAQLYVTGVRLCIKVHRLKIVKVPNQILLVPLPTLAYLIASKDTGD